LNEWDLADHFEMIVDRDTAGAPKPSAAPFHYVNQKLGIPPTRALHIGDSPFADIMGAINAEWQPLLLDPDNLFPDWDVARIQSLADLFDWLNRFEQEENLTEEVTSISSTE
jgi:FMN phosphatase YigB (HAD superfamily)